VKIDDPVGAVSVHGICGVWGTLAVGLFSTSEAHTVSIQLMGAASVSAFAFIFSLILAIALKVTIGIRVSAEEEQKGLDVEEHGAPAYHFGTDANELS
jgi:Amt family ammonium transporter